MLKLGKIGSLRSVGSVKPNGNWKPKKLQSVKPNCKGDVEGVSCWFKNWKVLGN